MERRATSHHLDNYSSHVVAVLDDGDVHVVSFAGISGISRIIVRLSNDYQNGQTLLGFGLDDLSYTFMDLTAVEESPPFEFSLEQSTPNPASARTIITFSTPTRGPVTLRVFDVRGRQVATLTNGILNSGPHTVEAQTGHWAAGIYFYRLEAAGLHKVRRLVVVR